MSLSYLLVFLLALGSATAPGRCQDTCKNGRLFGQRIPRRFIVVTGAHDLAMEDAGIHEFNLVEYTSILPPESEEICMEEARDKYFHHGAVLECIMSEVHGSRGDRITAGVGRMYVHKKEGTNAGKEGDKGEKLGGFAAEYKGHAMPEVAEKELKDSLQDIFDRRYDDKAHEMGLVRFNTSSAVVSKSFGTALAGICFVDYIFPDLGCVEEKEGPGAPARA